MLLKLTILDKYTILDQKQNGIPMVTMPKMPDCIDSISRIWRRNSINMMRNNEVKKIVKLPQKPWFGCQN